MLIWLPWYKFPSTTRRWKLAAGFLAGAALVLLPVAIRNYAIGGEFHLTTSQFGPNLYIGNNPHANGTYRPLRQRRGSAQHERSDAQELAQQQVGKPLTPGEVSAFWTNQAWHFMAEQPKAWLRLLGLKTVYTWNAVELVDTEDMYTYAEWSGLLRLSGYLFHFGLLVPLALWGICCTVAERRRLLPLYLMIGLYSLSVIAFYVVGRYRYPLVPPLVLLAAAGMTYARQFVRQGSYWLIITATLACVGAVVFCNLPVVSKNHLRAITHFNIGVALDDEGLYEAAIEQYQTTLTLDPHFDAVFNNLGCDYLHLGQYPRAIEQLRRAVAADSSFSEAVYNLGTAYLAERESGRALACFQQVIKLRPDLPPAHVGLGLAYMQQAKNTDARAALQRALELDPDSREAHAVLEKLSGENK